ncbi:MAG: DNA methylase N-4 [Alphaproteobacteria bacterium]|nr:DNA methylase N-4 [Alphaproteobacteria bacterium]
MPGKKPAATAPTLPDTLRLKIIYRKVDDLIPYGQNARTHSDKQICQIAASIRQFGFVNPILVGADNMIIAGHGRLAAAKLSKMRDVPTVRLDHLSEAERRALVIADNRLAELAGWDTDALRVELGELAALDLDFELEITGFETAELDNLLSPADPGEDSDDDIPPADDGPAVTQAGDIWRIGEHRLTCGDAMKVEVLAALMGKTQADMVFTDPPYNVPIDKHVCGSGKIKHREFAMGAGEMSPDQFTAFLETTLSLAANHAKDGSIHFVCMDWRHVGELLSAGRQVYSELKNLVVWAKTNAGMGSFYRSQHELVFVFKKGKAAHTNTFGLGDTGRYRSNVWTYPGVNAFGRGQKDLALHPTVKPVALIADVIKDVTKRGEIVLDVFGGSGSTLIAAERTRRHARLVEIDPAYCDVIIRRALNTCGLDAKLEATGQVFEDVAADRRGDNAAKGAAA